MAQVTKSSNMGKSSPISTNISHRCIAAIFLALGFLVIWTGMLAGVLMTETLETSGRVHGSLSAYKFHEGASRSAFVIGEELLATVDWLLNRSVSHYDHPEVDVAKSRTDRMLTSLYEHEPKKITDKLNEVRESISHSTRPEVATELYFQLNEELLRKCVSQHEPKHVVPVPSLAFTLFIQGAVKKFEEFALGSIYLNSKNSFNGRLTAKYLASHLEADELIKTALQFVPETKSSWWEVQYQHPVLNEIGNKVGANEYNKIYERVSNKQLKQYHAQLVRKQLKILKDTRKSMDDIFSAQITKIAKRSKNRFSFHISLSVISILAIVFCIIVIGCSLTELEGPARRSRSSVHNSNKMNMPVKPV